jgi:dienelactone hydrolase
MLVVASTCLNQGVLAQQSAEEPVPKNQIALPEQISVVVPDAGVSNELAVFSGAWSGDGWNGTTPTALVVEKIDQDGSADAIFSWGDVAASNRARGWLRLTAKIKQGRLGFSIPDHGTVEFNVATDGRLFGRYTLPTGRRDYVLLTRVAAADRGDIIAASQRMLSGEVVTFPVASNPDPKRTVQLRGILYRSLLAGRRPFVVFAGDSVVPEAARARPNLAPIRSRQMLSLGYSVLVLQRKGMGGSEGALMEPRDESISQQAQLQSALDDLDAAVTFMKQQEYVDPSRVVVMGIYRGGLLSVVYAGLHDGAVAGVVNTWGHWRVDRSWWRQKLTWSDFTAAQLAAAGKKTKVPMLWVYGANEPAALEYARANYKAFTYQGGRGTFVDVSDVGKSGSPNELLAERVDQAIAEYVQGLR